MLLESFWGRVGDDMGHYAHIARRLGFLLLPVALAPFLSVPDAFAQTPMACSQIVFDGVVDFFDSDFFGRSVIAYEGVRLVKRGRYSRDVGSGGTVRFVAGVDYDYAVGESARIDVCEPRDASLEVASIAQDAYMLLSFFGIVVVSLLSVLVMRR